MALDAGDPSDLRSEPPNQIPQYQLIANDLRGRIQRRELAAGAQVPTEKELAQRYGCSRNTVRMALQQLANEGLITAGRARAGRTVRRPERFALAQAVEGPNSGARFRGPDGFSDQAYRLGRAPTQRLEVEVVPAGPEQAARLEVPLDEKLVVRRHLRELDENPSHLSESFYPLALVRGTAVEDEREIVPSVLPLLAALGHREERIVDEIVARMPEPDEARRLRIGVGVPVIEHLRTGWSAERPIRLTRTVLPGDRLLLRYELPS